LGTHPLNRMTLTILNGTGLEITPHTPQLLAFQTP
jgi:hypothetical protein